MMKLTYFIAHKDLAIATYENLCHISLKRRRYENLCHLSLKRRRYENLELKLLTNVWTKFLVVVIYVIT
jgi:hypothetical protein